MIFPILPSLTLIPQPTFLPYFNVYNDSFILPYIHKLNPQLNKEFSK